MTTNRKQTYFFFLAQVRPQTTRRINLLTATVQYEVISNNSVTELYIMLYHGIWWYNILNLKR